MHIIERFKTIKDERKVFRTLREKEQVKNQSAASQRNAEKQGWALHFILAIFFFLKLQLHQEEKFRNIFLANVKCLFCINHRELIFKMSVKA